MLCKEIFHAGYLLHRIKLQILVKIRKYDQSHKTTTQRPRPRDTQNSFTNGLVLRFTPQHGDSTEPTKPCKGLKYKCRSA